jgi:hypothetical protein
MKAKTNQSLKSLPASITNAQRGTSFPSLSSSSSNSSSPILNNLSSQAARYRHATLNKYALPTSITLAYISQAIVKGILLEKKVSIHLSRKLEAGMPFRCRCSERRGRDFGRACEEKVWS